MENGAPMFADDTWKSLLFPFLLLFSMTIFLLHLISSFVGVVECTLGSSAMYLAFGASRRVQNHRLNFIKTTCSNFNKYIVQNIRNMYVVLVGVYLQKLYHRLCSFSFYDLRCADRLNFCFHFPQISRTHTNYLMEHGRA